MESPGKSQTRNGITQFTALIEGKAMSNGRETDPGTRIVRWGYFSRGWEENRNGEKLRKIYLGESKRNEGAGNAASRLLVNALGYLAWVNSR